MRIRDVLLEKSIKALSKSSEHKFNKYCQRQTEYSNRKHTQKITLGHEKCWHCKNQFEFSKKIPNNNYI